MIVDVLIAMVTCGVLFVIAGALRPIRRCSGHCGHCAASCELNDQESR